MGIKLQNYYHNIQHVLVIFYQTIDFLLNLLFIMIKRLILSIAVHPNCSIWATNHTVLASYLHK